MLWWCVDVYDKDKEEFFVGNSDIKSYLVRQCNV